MRQTNTMRNWAPMRPSKKPRPRCVAPEIMGYHHVDRAWIAHKLGLPAMRLWIYLMSNRDYRGRSFAFLVNAAAKIGMSKRTSIRAMARLMRARLVIPEGHQPHPTPRHKLVRAHIVRGGPNKSIRTRMRLPRDSRDLIAQMGSGGARPGAGRHIKDSMNFGIQKGIVAEGQSGASEFKRGSLLPPDSPKSETIPSDCEGADKARSDIGSISDHLSFPQKEKNKRADAARSSFSSPGPAAPSAPPTILTEPPMLIFSPSLDLERRCAPPDLPTAEGSVPAPSEPLRAGRSPAVPRVPSPRPDASSGPQGARKKDPAIEAEWDALEALLTANEQRRADAGDLDILAARCARADQQQHERFVGIVRAFAPGDIVPRYPTPNELCMARLPAPPRLREEHGDDERVRLLLRAYWGATNAHFGEPNLVLANCDVRASAYWRKLLDAAEVLYDLDIAPAAWCSFSCDVWRNNDKRGGKRPPPIAWVFGVNRILERAGWFAHERGSYGGGRILFSPLHKTICAKFSGLMRFLAREQTRVVDCTPEQACERVAALVEQFFPGGWREWFERGRVEGRAGHEKLAAMLAHGDYVW